MPKHPRNTVRTDLERLKRIEGAYWTLFAVLLVLLSLTVIAQFLTADQGVRAAWMVTDGWYRRLLSVGLPGLILLFSLYVTAKRQEIQRLKRDLFDQQTLAERLEEKTLRMEGAQEETARARLRDRALFSLLDREVREPLRTIAEAARDRERRAEIRRDSGALLRRVEDLIEWGEIEAGRASWSLSEQDPADILRDVSAEVEPIAGDRGITLQRDRMDRTPLLLADRPRLLRALARVTEWMVRSAPAGGTVTLSAEATDDSVRLAVRDERPAFAERERDSFHALDGSGGTGGGEDPSLGGEEIGLALAHGVARHFGGNLVLEEGVGGCRACALVLPVPRLSPALRSAGAEAGAAT